MPKIAVNFSNILKAAGPRAVKNFDTDAFKARATRTIKANPYVAEYGNRLNEAALDPELGPALKPFMKGLLNYNKDSIKSAYLKLDSEIKARDFGKSLSVEGLSDKQTFANTKVFIKQTLRFAEHNFKQGFRRYEQDLLRNFKKEGLEVAEAFKILLKAPSKFEKLYGTNQDAVIAAIYDGVEIPNNPVANSIIKSISTSEDSLIKQLQDSGTVIGQAKKYFLPFHIDPDSVTLKGEDAMVKLLIETTPLTDKGAKNLVTLIADQDNPVGLNKLQSIFLEQKLRFNNGQAMIRFFKEVNGTDFQHNLFNKFFGHKQRIIRMATLQQAYGEIPVDSLSRGILRARKQLGTTIDPELNEAYKGLIKNFEHRLELLAGRSFVSEPIAQNLSSSLNRVLSLVTGAPAKSTIRNLFIDYEANAASIGKTLYNDNFQIGGSAKRIFKGLSYLVGSALRNTKHTAAINDILNIAGWANSLDGLSKGNILSFEDVFDQSVAARARGKDSGLKATATNVTAFIDNKLRQAQDGLFKWSGNHSLIDFVRARRFISIQQMFTNVFKHASYDEWIGSMTPLELKQLDFLRTNFDLNKGTFEFLKKASKTKLDINHKTYKELGFDPMPEYISKDSILRTSDDLANKFKKPHETAKQYKERIARGWQKFVYNSSQSFAPVTTIADSLTAPLFSNVPPFMAATLRPFVKFADPAHAQAASWAEDMAVAIYGRPTQYLGSASLVAWGKGLAMYTAYGAAAVWARDIFKNRAPTDFRDPQNALKLVLLSGFGGYGNMVAGNALGAFPSFSSSAYATTPLGAAFYDVKNLGRAMTQERGKFGATVSALHNANPFTQLWWASGLVDYGINQILLEPRQLKQKYKNLENYGKPYLF